MPRQLALGLIKVALVVGETRFARRLALAWLASYPGDLQASLLHAQVLLVEHHQGRSRGSTSLDQAIAILENLYLADPEWLEAQETLLVAYTERGIPSPAKEPDASAEPADLPPCDTVGNILSLGGYPNPEFPLPTWANSLKQSRKALERGNLDMAEQLVHQALLANAATPLIALTHIQVETQRGLPLPSIRSLAELYHDRWPACLAFSLFLADALMDGGEPDQAVALIHQAAAQDVTSQVVERLWGKDHPYQNLWPGELEISLPEDLAIPAGVAAALGLNQLPPAGEADVYSTDQLDLSSEPSSTPQVVAQDEGEPDIHEAPTQFTEITDVPQAEPEAPAPEAIPARQSHSLPESLRSIQAELQRLAERIRRPQLARGDGRFPAYVIFTTRAGLVSQYGVEMADQLDAVMKDLVDAVRARKTWDALLFYADLGLPATGRDGSTTLAVKPAKPSDAWSLKLSLADLDTALARHGEMIGAVLIAGGPEIIPFHQLPNPLDDVDVDVPSDNPYATRDENYFIPEWPVGRLPGGTGSDGSLLIKALQAMILHHQEADQPKSWFSRWWEKLVERYWPDPLRLRPSLGYTAAIWRQAALSVYNPIGEARSMQVSPPVHVNGKPVQEMPRNERLYLLPVRMGYFNLHGLQDATEWYGQKDPTHPEDGPDYPVALRPQDIGDESRNGNGCHSPKVVFSEACYGAHILDRKIDQSIALKFLESGSLAVVGSTVTAYGSITMPLAAGDLLGYAFWNYLNEGFPTGEALRRAKIHLAKEMHRRQGYLDGEDQKTLISFVLYGDPLAQPAGRVNPHKTIFRSIKPPSQVKTVCDRSENPQQPRPLPPEMLNYVKHVVEQYLPGMDDAQLELVDEHADCPGWLHSCPTAQFGAKSRPTLAPDRHVVTLSKQVPRNTYVHQHYARLTLDSSGKLVKLVVSR